MGVRIAAITSYKISNIVKGNAFVSHVIDVLYYYLLSLVLTMFLAPLDVLGPVARVSFLVVQQPADAQLFGGRAVPASPVSCARRLMTEYSVQPIAVFPGYRTVCGKQTRMVILLIVWQTFNIMLKQVADNS